LAKRKRSSYKALQNKFFWNILGSALLAAGLFFLLLLLGYGSGLISDVIVRLFELFFRMDYSTAVYWYDRLFRELSELWMALAFLLLFFIFLHFNVRFVGRYFDEVSRGVAQLATCDGKPIELSDELKEVERNLNDVREALQRREAETRTEVQRKNDLVMYLAHDIRTPLTSVIGYLSLLDEAPDMPAAQRAKYTRLTLEKAERLETLVNEFFEITRYDLRELPLEKEELDLHYLLVQLTDEFYPQLQANRNTVRLDAAEDLRLVGDGLKLARVFNNLLKNAVAYSTPDSEITVTATAENGLVTILFQNHGKTIPAEKLSHLFEKFYRLDEARTTNGGGAGLGLAIAKEIVAAHDGTITAASADGVTTFTVTLPQGTAKSL